MGFWVERTSCSHLYSSVTVPFTPQFTSTAAAGCRPQRCPAQGEAQSQGRANLEVLGHEGQTPKNLLPEVSGSSGILPNPPDQFSAKWAEPRGSGSTGECGSPAVGCRVESRTTPWASRCCRLGPLCSQPPHPKQSPFRVA